MTLPREKKVTFIDLDAIYSIFHHTMHFCSGFIGVPERHLEKRKK